MLGRKGPGWRSEFSSTQVILGSLNLPSCLSLSMRICYVCVSVLDRSFSSSSPLFPRHPLLLSRPPLPSNWIYITTQERGTRARVLVIGDHKKRKQRWGLGGQRTIVSVLGFFGLAESGGDLCNSD